MSHPTDDHHFRLPRSIRPRRYQLHLALDLDQKSFAGSGQIELSLDKPVRELTLHGIALELSRAELVGPHGRTAAARIERKEASETLLLTFDAELPAGPSTLELAWTGKFTEGLRGLYMAGKVASTQFEAADARRVFPCFDEPAFKATWALSVEAPAGLAVLGNGAVVSDEPKDGRRVVRFAETEVLPSYLIALVVGPLVATEPREAVGVPMRTWCLPEKLHLTKFAQEAAANALPRLQDYFGLPYAFVKLDQVGIPDFEAGAMENAGLITYREVALLLDEATAPLSVQKRVAEVITHELAHQWFGNWVTMVWWDDLWLNEAFATWMAYKIVDAWRPEWRVWLDFDAGKAAALHLDALKSTHPIRGEVRNANEAGESFDAITYEKGGAVLRMIEGFLGEGPFREGIRAYMKKFARANAVADDLWGALQAASSQPVIEVANRWIRQSGYPLVSVSANGRRLRLEQHRFYSAPGHESVETWPVPLVLRFKDGAGVHERRYLLNDRSIEHTLPGDGPIEWLCANGGATGFYRVQYDPVLLAQLGKHLAQLEPAERVSLIADQWALVRAGKAPISALLDLAERFADERDHAVLDELIGKLAYVERRLVDGGAQLRFRSFVERLFGPRLDAIGWEGKSGESDDERLRRAALVAAVGGIGRSPRALEQARARVKRLLDGDKGALDPNLHDVAVAMCARAGDAALFDKLLAIFPNEPDPATKRRYLMALAGFEDAALAKRGQQLFFEGKVPMQDTSGFVNGLLANRTGRDSFWASMRERWADVLAKTGGAPMLLRRVVEAMGNLTERRHLDEVKAHLKAHPVEEAKQASEQTVERLTQDVELKERIGADVTAWVQAKA